MQSPAGRGDAGHRGAGAPVPDVCLIIFPNHILVFAPGDTTFHGVEPVTGPAIRRRVRLFALVDTHGPRR